MSKLYVNELQPKTAGGIVSVPAVAFKISPSAADTVAHGASTILTRDTVLIDTHSLASTNGFTITAATAGFWWVHNVWRTDNFVSTRQLSYIKKNGVDAAYAEVVINSNDTSRYPSISVVAVLKLVAGDVIQGAAYQQYGSSKTLLADAAGIFNYLEGYRIGG